MRDDAWYVPETHLMASTKRCNSSGCEEVRPWTETDKAHIAVLAMTPPGWTVPEVGGHSYNFDGNSFTLPNSEDGPCLCGFSKEKEDA